MTRILFSMIFVALMAARGAVAQSPDDTVFIQVQARTSLAGAQASVRRFSRALPDVNGFSLGGGWYGIALGPYSRAEAEDQLRDLRSQRLVPADSYIEEARAYGQQFWPVGAQAGRAPVEPAEPSVQAEPVQQQVAEPAPQVEPEESPREARASERELSRAQRDELQIALRWAGFYDANIDGAFGRGTRSAMADWQANNGHEPTGVLTTRQRAQLLGQYYAVLEGLGMEQYTDPRAGVSVQLPLGVVAFDRYESPFAVFSPKGDLSVRVLLISQPGDTSALNALYEIMQTLEIVPLDGERKRDRNGFVLTGANDRIVSHTEVDLRGGEIKGFTLIWPAGDEERRTRVLGLMQQSYQRTDGVLNPATISDEGQSVDLVAGLRVRQPRVNGSGFFIEARGTVLTSAETVEACERITLNGLHKARVVASDAALGVAILQPEEQLAPRRVAEFSNGVPRLQSEIAVAGYSFGGVLTAPTLTFGTLEDVRGLSGEEDMKRLALAALPGDVGGPVFDAGGHVVGMLLPREQEDGRRLPDEVSFAAKGEMILDFLNQNGIRPVSRSGVGPMAPEDLTALASDTTVLVGCW